MIAAAQSLATVASIVAIALLLVWAFAGSGGDGRG